MFHKLDNSFILFANKLILFINELMNLKSTQNDNSLLKLYYCFHKLDNSFILLAILLIQIFTFNQLDNN